MVQPSGPSIHFCTSAGSVCARYTASGGAAKCLVTRTCLSPSVFRVILLIAVPLLGVPRRRSPGWVGGLNFCQELVQPVVIFRQGGAQHLQPLIDPSRLCFASLQGCFAPCTRRTISPAFSSTRRCREIAGCDIWNGLASSMTVVSPSARRARMARRVGSERAEKVASRLGMAANKISNCYITNSYIKHFFKPPDRAVEWVCGRCAAL